MNEEIWAFIFNGFKRNLAIDGLNNVFCNQQTDAWTVGFCGEIRAKNLVLNVLWNPCPIVANAQNSGIFLPIKTDTDDAVAVRWNGLDGVFYQIIERTGQLRTVGIDDKRLIGQWEWDIQLFPFVVVLGKKVGNGLH